jgi:hypothetical protein
MHVAARPSCFKSDNTALTSKNRPWRRILVHNPLYPYTNPPEHIAARYIENA